MKIYPYWHIWWIESTTRESNSMTWRVQRVTNILQQLLDTFGDRIFIVLFFFHPAFERKSVWFSDGIGIQRVLQLFIFFLFLRVLSQIAICRMYSLRRVKLNSTNCFAVAQFLRWYNVRLCFLRLARDYPLTRPDSFVIKIFKMFTPFDWEFQVNQF